MLTALASLAVGVVGASAASANVTWAQGNTTMKLAATSVSVKLQGGSSVTCTNATASGEAQNGETTSGYVANDIEGSGSFSFSCPNSTRLGFHAYVEPSSVISENHEYRLAMYDSFIGKYKSPFGEYNQDGEATGVYVDGSGTTPSTLTFKEAVIGHLRTFPNTAVLLTATFKATTGSGGLLTLIGHF
ncbi:MAG TPA: hypothetical protein VFN85_06155 [Solirubrobacterales bacterium]|nr:hypothetical protein [Solirubrobacterales bacterium]